VSDEAAWHLREIQKECGSVDKDLKAKIAARMKRCSRNHLNSPSAQACWKCGEPLLKGRLER
jgi:ribosomal protein L32